MILYNSYEDAGIVFLKKYATLLPIEISYKTPIRSPFIIF